MPVEPVTDLSQAWCYELSVVLCVFQRGMFIICGYERERESIALIRVNKYCTAERNEPT